MTLGPVQLLVLGFAKPDFDGEIATELRRLRDNGLVRVIDALAVYKDADGDVAAVAASRLGGGESAEFGTLVDALVSSTEPAAGGDGTTPAGDDGWDVLADIPADSAAALILLEHRWAVPLRDAVVRAGGFRLASEFVSPLDLVAIGLLGETETETVALASTDRDVI